jgi:ribosome biogenesis protein YTM1
MAASRDDDEDNEEEIGEQVRVSFVLDPSVSDRSLEVPSEPIAIPADLRRKGLSAVINHLLERQVGDDEEEDEDSDEVDEKLKALPFDFIIANRLLRTGVETAARRHGLSLEQAIRISYFPAQESPEESNEGEPLPDWISTLNFRGGFVCTGGYDGSVVVHKPSQDALETISSVSAHSGPIKCLATMEDVGGLTIATGSLDHTIVTHRFDKTSKSLAKHANFVGGHTSSIGCVDMISSQQRLVSGDWDGGLSLWDFSSSVGESDDPSEEAVKKRKTGSKSKKSVLNIRPMSTIPAHASQISGVSWGNSPHANGKTLITGSWDNSLKVWDVERQDCLLTLNGSRVISCLDTSYHSEVVATGHPDCTIRLWDVRTAGDTTSSLVSDSSLKPSHKAWVSAVKWSPNDPYVLASTSHDGTMKIWDIRSSLPLHTVRVHPKEEKGLCLAFGDGVIFTGGSDCVVKQYKC